MKTRTVKIAAIAFLLAFALPALLSSGRMSDSESEPLITGLADPSALVDFYNEWAEEYEKAGGDRNLVVPVGYSKGLSDEYTKAHGQVRINKIDGLVSVEIRGLQQEAALDFWLVDNVSGQGRSIAPEQGDIMVRAGSLVNEGKHTRLEVNLGSEAFSSFEPDLFIVTRAGKGPDESRILVGHTTLFHRLYRSAQRGQFGVIEDADEIKQPEPKKNLFARLLDVFSPSAQAQGTIPPIDSLVARGRFIFFNETFNGNLRTCGSCHREENNLTIDPTFIGTLDPNDPLFVAEFDANLEKLENPILMRNVGLILENVDGLQDPTNKFVMRSVPHTLALRTSIRSNLPGFANATGWSGDGAPSGETLTDSFGTTHSTTGSLRDFAIGAVRQHFTKTLNRNPNPPPGIMPDFRLPTNFELDALVAFQLSTGRQKELTLPLALRGPLALLGQSLFINTGCNGCHNNAGANSGGFNNNFDTNVEDLLNPPGDLFGQENPPDGGFGATDPPPPFPQDPTDGFGDNTFNTPPTIEAADTGPFFHNNSLSTIEGAVQFYNDGLGFGLTSTDVQAIGAFLRVINALENIRAAIALEETAKLQANLSAAQLTLGLAIEELDDAILVLSTASLHPVAVNALNQAKTLDQQAANTADQAARNALIDQALTLKRAARADMIQ